VTTKMPKRRKGQLSVCVNINMRASKNTFITTVKRMGRLNKMIALSVLIIVMKAICDSLVISRQELGQPIFLEAIFGLTQMETIKLFGEKNLPALEPRQSTFFQYNETKSPQSSFALFVEVSLFRESLLL